MEPIEPVKASLVRLASRGGAWAASQAAMRNLIRPYRQPGPVG
jgi:hypothetical protein